jgi:hypothetical protein
LLDEAAPADRAPPFSGAYCDGAGVAGAGSGVAGAGSVVAGGVAVEGASPVG